MWEEKPIAVALCAHVFAGEHQSRVRWTGASEADFEPPIAHVLFGLEASPPGAGAWG